MPGETGVAQAMGEPKAVRAVAQANGRNYLAIIIPCHRVIAAGGLEHVKSHPLQDPFGAIADVSLVIGH